MNKEVKLWHDCFSECSNLKEIVFPEKEMEIDDMCVDLCPMLSAQTKSHIRITEEGIKRRKERTLGFRIKKNLKDIGSGAMSILMLLLIAPFALLAYLAFAYVGTIIVGTVQIFGVAAILTFIIGYGIMLILQLLLKFEHKIDATYIIECIAIGGLVLCPFYFLHNCIRSMK